jgi:hypothetical protein
VWSGDDRNGIWRYDGHESRTRLEIYGGSSQDKAEKSIGGVELLTRKLRACPDDYNTAVCGEHPGAAIAPFGPILGCVNGVWTRVPIRRSAV